MQSLEAHQKKMAVLKIQGMFVVLLFILLVVSAVKSFEEKASSLHLNQPPTSPLEEFAQSGGY